MDKNNLTRERVLVTGGSGFIGSHLCDALVRRDKSVLSMDNGISGQMKNLSQLLSHRNFEHIQHDLTLPFEIDANEVYNLACPASPKHYQKDAIATVRTNVLGTLNLLENSKRQLGCKTLQASTSEIYGDPEIHPQTEDYKGNVDPTGPRACYDEGKRCAETLFFDYHRSFEIEIKVARIFNTYGPRMRLDDGRVVSNFIRQALDGQDIQVYGNGQQTRSFCHVDDLVEGLISLMDAPSHVIGPINLGRPIEFTILELADIILTKISGPSKIVFAPLPEDDPKQRKPDITRAKEYLGWEPEIALEDGLEDTIAYFKSEYFK
ncbi:MAG: UDP-glucuronic acid decarboxylase family protein [Pseudomonadota bacterium]